MRVYGWSLACVASLVGLGACSSNEFSPERPFRDAWTVEATIDFVHTNADGELLIPKLTIGGKGDKNFGNRGDVVVLFDGPPDTMTVELRRFVMATNEQSATDQFDVLELWPYEGRLDHPDDKSDDEACWDGWRSGCALRVFADAGTQREASGADIRVTLPPDYRGVLDIETEDDSAISDYLNRGDVCIDGLPGSAEVQMQSGRAWIRIAPDVTPVPTCSAQDVAACESFTLPDGDGQPQSAPWASQCPCLSAGHQFGRVTVDSRDLDITDVTVDVPADLWSSLNLENRLTDATARDCEARISLPEDQLELDPQDSAAELRGMMNFPGSPAVRGAGYRIALASGTCGAVGFTEGPDQFVEDGPQGSERRGDLEVCTDCLPRGCDTQIP